MHYSLVAKNTLYQFASRLVSSFTGFLIAIIIARFFGVLGFGEYIKITSYVTLFYLLIDFGLNAIFLNLEKQDFKTFFYLRIFISSLLFIIINLVAFILPYDVNSLSGFSFNTKLGILIFSLSVFSQSLILSSIAIFQKNVNFKFYAKGIIIGSVVNLILVFGLAFLKFSILYVLFAFVLTGFLTGALHIMDTKEKLLPFSFDKKYARDIFVLALPIGLMLLFNLIYFRADIILLSLMSTTKSVGIYGLSYKFFDFLIAIPLFLSNAVYPFLIKYKNDQAIFKKLINRYLLIFFSMSLVLILVFWFSTPLFTFIKSDFSKASIPFRILLMSLPFFFVTSLIQWALITKEKQKFLMYTYFFSLIINIFLNIIFIPTYSYLASAWITLVCEGGVFLILSIKLLIVLNYIRIGNKNYE